MPVHEPSVHMTPEQGSAGKDKFGPAEPSRETEAALDYLRREGPNIVQRVAPYLPVHGQAEVAQQVLLSAWSNTGEAKALRSSPRDLGLKFMKGARDWLTEDNRSSFRSAKRGLKYLERCPKLAEHVQSPDAVLATKTVSQALEDAVDAMPPKRRAACLASRRIKDHSQAAASCGISLAAYNKHLVRANQDIERAVAPLLAESEYA
jgi:DNA-directed RNA polymerase specialized sigma24 family protein